MLENKLTSLEEKIQKQIENKIELLMETRFQVIEKENQDTNQTSQQGDANNIGSLKMKDMIKELERKLTTVSP